MRTFDDETGGQWFSPSTAGERLGGDEQGAHRGAGGRGACSPLPESARWRPAKANGSWTVLDGPESGIEPPELTAALDAVPAARATWDAFPKSVKKFGLTHIAMAKRAETKAARIAKIVADAAEGKRP
ncbi:YdeI/OmpD-associated family protein [Microbacterium sp. NRRL B-14842]|uniref:YdeI/OmpD-associated family protein n=1 Tax=Microbacterium sp. NRRL B-14842 TaxID=3162881 RepID=UPI003D2A962F